MHDFGVGLLMLVLNPKQSSRPHSNSIFCLYMVLSNIELSCLNYYKYMYWFSSGLPDETFSRVLNNKATVNRKN